MRAIVLAASAAAMMVVPMRAVIGQVPDTAKSDSTFDIRSLWRDRGERSSFTLTSGKAYNRVEGLPIMLGPTYRGKLGDAIVLSACLASSALLTPRIGTRRTSGTV